MASYTNKNNFSPWAIVAIIGLLGLNAYQYFNYSQLKTQSDKLDVSFKDLEKTNVQLDQDYQNALNSLETMRSDNKELNALIDSQKKELTIQKAKVSEMINVKRDLGRARAELDKLNSLASTYVAQIEKLKQENTVLTESNTKLQTANADLTTTVEQERKAKEEISEAKAALATEKESLSKTNEALSSKVDLANAIKINYVDVKGYDIKDDGKLKEKDKAKDVEMLRVCFKTETNLVTKSGTKTFYVRIISPQGETVAVESAGSGILTNKLDNTQVKYSISGDIDYNNEDTNGCIDWKLENKLGKGVYTLEMFNNGYLVGRGSFKLK